MPAKPSIKDLQISSRASDEPLTPDHKRFNTLIKQIAQARATHAEWEENIPLFIQAYGKVVEPLRLALVDVFRKVVFALDALLDRDGWSRPDRASLRAILCDQAGRMLAEGQGDEELQALFDKHSEVDFATDKRQELQDFMQLAEQVTGIDLGDVEGIQSDDDLAQRMFERMQARETAEAEARAAKTKRKGKTAAQKKREAEAQLATQSVRDIYRKLVSAVHPDREPDPEQRAVRTALMQDINQAYAANDLLKLLEIQVQLEQVDATHIAGLGAQRLKQYNKVLAEQLAALKEETVRLQSNFYGEFGIEPRATIHPRKLNGLLQERAQMLRSATAHQQQDLRSLADPAAAKRWLKQQRRSARQAQYDDEDFY